MAQSDASSPTQVPAAPPIRLANGAFVLTIDSPADQAVLSQSQVDIHGTVSADAVLTVDNDTYVLGAGPFTEPVTLSEGLNAVQIVASDMDGNEVDSILTLVYQP